MHTRIDLFRGAGYAPTALGWPGDGDTVAEMRDRPERVAGYGIDDVVRHHAQMIEALDQRPIVIGHSFGGLIAQRLLSEPLLLTAGGKDHTVPAAITRSTLKLYRKSSAVTDFKEFPDRGHTLALDSGWREVADSVLAWLKAHSL